MDSLRLDERRIIYKNFKGETRQFNKDGSRVFSIVIDDLDEAESLLADGWALRPLKDEEDNVTAYHLPAKINFNSPRPPRIYQLRLESNQPPLMLDEDLIDFLDTVDIAWVDVELNPFQWSVGGNTGIKAYVHVMYVKVEYTALDRKYLLTNEE